MIDKSKNFEIILVDLNRFLCEEWRKAFKKYPNVSVVNDYFQNVPNYDCMVSPANSFGIMDGGIDKAIIQYFGIELQHQVQKVITEEYFGEQPVGTSFIVKTGNKKHPFLAHSPTMRTPMKITRTDNVYNAMFATLRAVANYNKTHRKKIKSIACSGLGTATGRVTPKEGARQMELAYRYFLEPEHLTWFHANQRQKNIGFGGDIF
jgi:O-acetyl-ADP-ribose deacetylase (regulator of RNase III)